VSALRRRRSGSAVVVWWGRRQDCSDFFGPVAAEEEDGTRPCRDERECLLFGCERPPGGVLERVFDVHVAWSCQVWAGVFAQIRRRSLAGGVAWLLETGRSGSLVCGDHGIVQRRDVPRSLGSGRPPVGSCTTIRWSRLTFALRFGELLYESPGAYNSCRCGVDRAVAPGSRCAVHVCLKVGGAVFCPMNRALIAGARQRGVGRGCDPCEEWAVPKVLEQPLQLGSLHDRSEPTHAMVHERLTNCTKACRSTTALAGGVGARGV
jgi:hypothetical protein